MLEKTSMTDVISFIQDIPKKLGGVFSPQRPIYIAQVPGRLDIIGGICASCGGTVVQSPLAQGVMIAIQWRSDQRILMRNLNLNKERILTIEYRLDEVLRAAGEQDWISLQTLFSAPEKRWSGHVLGAIAQLCARYPLQKGWPGFNVAISSSLPVGAGLGSSAALQAGLILTLREALNLPFDASETASIAAAIETEVMQQPGHPADYSAILHGQKNKLMVLHCQENSAPRFLDLPNGLQWATLDSGIRKPAEWQKQREFQAALHMGSSLLHELIRAGAPVSEGDVERTGVSRQVWQSHFKKRIPYRRTGEEFLGSPHVKMPAGVPIDPQKKYMPRSAVEYLIEENERARAFVSLFEERPPDSTEQAWIEAGALLFASHDHYCKMSGLVCPEADWLVEQARALGSERGIYGARAMPGGMGSSIVILAAANANDTLQNLVSQYQDRFGRPASLLRGSAAGCLQSGVVTTQFD